MSRVKVGSTMPRKIRKDFLGKKFQMIELTDNEIKKMSDDKIKKMILAEIGKVDFIVLLGALWYHLQQKGEWDLMVENEKIVHNLLKLRNEQVNRS